MSTEKKSTARETRIIDKGELGVIEVNLGLDLTEPNWADIANQIKEKARWKCERCGHSHQPEMGYTLTVHHLDGHPANCADWNLAALCQRCHLKVQARILNIIQLWLLESEDWLIPHYQGMRESKLESTLPDSENNSGRPITAPPEEKPILTTRQLADYLQPIHKLPRRRLL